MMPVRRKLNRFARCTENYPLRRLGFHEVFIWQFEEEVQVGHANLDLEIEPRRNIFKKLRLNRRRSHWCVSEIFFKPVSAEGIHFF